MKSAYEISLLESRLTQFQNDKESFMNDLLKNDEIIVCFEDKCGKIAA